MCEFLKTFDFSDLVAIGSAIILFLTLRKQGENNKMQKQLAEMDMMAKRAEYLPILDGKVRHTIPIYSEKDQIGSYVDLTVEHPNAIISVDFTIIRNGLSILEIKFDEPHELYEMVLPEFKDKFYGLNGAFSVSFQYDFLERHRLSKDENLGVVLNRYYFFDKPAINLKITIIYKDVLRNVYEQSVYLEKGENVVLGSINLIEKPAK